MPVLLACPLSDINFCPACLPPELRHILFALGVTNLFYIDIECQCLEPEVDKNIFALFGKLHHFRVLKTKFINNNVMFYILTTGACKFTPKIFCD
jgi:hypothetical protein